MLDALFHFLAGTVGSLLVFLVFVRLSGVGRFSAPFGLVFIGAACAALAHFLSPWATPAVIACYAASSALELWRDKRMQKAQGPRDGSC